MKGSLEIQYKLHSVIIIKNVYLHDKSIMINLCALVLYFSRVKKMPLGIKQWYTLITMWIKMNTILKQFQKQKRYGQANPTMLNCTKRLNNFHLLVCDQ